MDLYLGDRDVSAEAEAYAESIISGEAPAAGEKSLILSLRRKSALRSLRKLRECFRIIRKTQKVLQNTLI